MNKFKVGDKVKWSSQAAGVWKEKVGEVVAVVKAKDDPRKYVPWNYRLKDCGAPRDEESYLVRVGKRINLNWPITNKLALVDPTAISEWLSACDGDAAHINTIDELMEFAGRRLDKACSHDIVGECLFKANNGKIYVGNVEFVIQEANPEYVKSVLDEE